MDIGARWLSPAERAWIRDHTGASLPDIQKATRRLAAIRRAGSISAGARRAGISHTAILKWLRAHEYPDLAILRAPTVSRATPSNDHDHGPARIAKDAEALKPFLERRVAGFRSWRINRDLAYKGPVSTPRRHEVVGAHEAEGIVCARELVAVLRDIVGRLPGATGISFHPFAAWTSLYITVATDAAVDALAGALGLGASERGVAEGQWWYRAASPSDLGITVIGPLHKGPPAHDKSGKG